MPGTHHEVPPDMVISHIESPYTTSPVPVQIKYSPPFLLELWSRQTQGKAWPKSVVCSVLALLADQINKTCAGSTNCLPIFVQVDKAGHPLDDDNVANILTEAVRGEPGELLVPFLCKEFSTDSHPCVLLASVKAGDADTDGHFTVVGRSRGKLNASGCMETFLNWRHGADGWLKSTRHPRRGVATRPLDNSRHAYCLTTSPSACDELELFDTITRLCEASIDGPSAEETPGLLLSRFMLHLCECLESGRIPVPTVDDDEGDDTNQQDANLEGGGAGNEAFGWAQVMIQFIGNGGLTFLDTRQRCVVCQITEPTDHMKALALCDCCNKFSCVRCLREWMTLSDRPDPGVSVSPAESPDDGDSNPQGYDVNFGRERACLVSNCCGTGPVNEAGVTQRSILSGFIVLESIDTLRPLGRFMWPQPRFVDNTATPELHQVEVANDRLQVARRLDHIILESSHEPDQDGIFCAVSLWKQRTLESIAGELGEENCRSIYRATGNIVPGWAVSQWAGRYALPLTYGSETYGSSSTAEGDTTSTYVEGTLTRHRRGGVARGRYFKCPPSLILISRFCVLLIPFLFLTPVLCSAFSRGGCAKRERKVRGCHVRY